MCKRTLIFRLVCCGVAYTANEFNFEMTIENHCVKMLNPLSKFNECVNSRLKGVLL